ncbi:hypothetical protein D3C84_433270 [compost metagenome]
MLKQARRNEIVGNHQRIDRTFGQTFGQHFHGAEGVRGFDEFYLWKLCAQIRHQRIALGDGQTFSLQLLKIDRAVRLPSRQQDIGILQIGAAEMEQGVPLRAGEQGGNQVGLVVLDSLDHVGVAATALDIEAQAGTQADQFQ